MIVDLTEKTENGTFDLRGGGTLSLRLLNARDMKEMNESCIKRVSEYPYLPVMKDGEPTGVSQYVRFERQEINQDLWNDMLYDRTITGWTGITGPDDKAIECKKENKVRMMMFSPDFREAYDTGMKALKEAEASRREAEQKNSLTG